MKVSEAILRGIEAVNGRQMTEVYCEGEHTKPHRVCVLGAWALGATGSALHTDAAARMEFQRIFESEWGFSASYLNDLGMPLDHLYGMTVAAGL